MSNALSSVSFALAHYRYTPAYDHAAMTELAAATPSGGTIWGIGNYHGFGARLIAAVARQGTPC